MQKNFKKRPWTSLDVILVIPGCYLDMQDSAPSQGAKKSQEWLSANVPNFIFKEKWPPSPPDLNPLDFGIWGFLKSKVSATHHKSLEALKMKL